MLRPVQRTEAGHLAGRSLVQARRRGAFRVSLPRLRTSRAVGTSFNSLGAYGGRAAELIQFCPESSDGYRARFLPVMRCPGSSCPAWSPAALNDRCDQSVAVSVLPGGSQSGKL